MQPAARVQAQYGGEQSPLSGKITKAGASFHASRPPLSQPSASKAVTTLFENKDGSFTFKLDILPQTKFQLRQEKPLAKEEVAAE